MFFKSQADAFASLLDEKASRLLQVLVGFLCGTWLFVPLHELLHVTGCLVTGGDVTRLEISPLFGGALFHTIFPWVISGGAYAGRLSGFRPAGDLSYLVTVLAPHLVLCPAGSALARAAVRRHQAWLLGLGLAAAMQPLASLSGDWYEAAAIPLTRLAAGAGWRWAAQLRGDDIFVVAHQAASIHSLWAWVLLAAGCVAGGLAAALTLALSGGIAPRPSRRREGIDRMRVRRARPDSGRWTRRYFLRVVLGVASVATGAWILKRVLLPRRLKPSEMATFAAFVDTLIPDGEFPGARRTGILAALLTECEATRQTRRALLEGVGFLDRRAVRRGAADFVSVATPEREAIVEECAQAEEGSLPRFFYRVVRHRAMRLHYAHPAAWKPLRFPHPPQPDGYIDYWQAPDV